MKMSPATRSFLSSSGRGSNSGNRRNSSKSHTSQPSNWKLMFSPAACMSAATASESSSNLGPAGAVGQERDLLALIAGVGHDLLGQLQVIRPVGDVRVVAEHARAEDVAVGPAGLTFIDELDVVVDVEGRGRWRRAARDSRPAGPRSSSAAGTGTRCPRRARTASAPVIGRVSREAHREVDIAGLHGRHPRLLVGQEDERDLVDLRRGTPVVGVAGRV